MSTFVLPKEYIDFCKNNSIVDKTKYDTSICERHHILPKCKGGMNNEENLCYLTIEKHFEAHLLLAQLTNDCKLWGILYMMLKTRKKHKITLKDRALYKKIRSEYRKATRECTKQRWLDQEYIANLSKKAKERWKDPEYAKKCNFGRDRPEVRKKIIDKLKQTLSTKEAKELKSLRSKQNWQRPEYKAKMKAALRAYWKRKHEEKEQLKKGGPCDE